MSEITLCIFHNLEGFEVLEILKTSFPRGGLKQRNPDHAKTQRATGGRNWEMGTFEWGVDEYGWLS